MFSTYIFDVLVRQISYQYLIYLLVFFNIYILVIVLILNEIKYLLSFHLFV